VLTPQSQELIRFFEEDIEKNILPTSFTVRVLDATIALLKEKNQVTVPSSSSPPSPSPFSCVV